MLTNYLSYQRLGSDVEMHPMLSIETAGGKSALTKKNKISGHIYSFEDVGSDSCRPQADSLWMFCARGGNNTSCSIPGTTSA